MRRVILESPYGSADPAQVEENVAYARRCVRDCLARGEAPIASHLLYTQPGVLNDSDPAERAWGIEAGLEWGGAAEASVFYIDRGLSRGMQYGVAHAVKGGRKIEFRALDPEHLNKVVALSVPGGL
jgi:hypothetical protein